MEKSSAVKKTKVNTLVPYKSSSDEEETGKVPAVMKNGVQKVVSSEERTSSKSFLMWENNANVCWLDASMALVVHNQTLIKSIPEDSSSQIAKIVKYYYEAVSILNNCSDERHIEVRVQVAKDLLKNVQESVLKYLQPILKYTEGEPDSAFCALYNLISEDKSLKSYFEVEFSWFQSCKECGTHRVRKHKKPIVTLPKVIHFQAQCPVAIYQCPKCKESNQKMTLNFRNLPACLLFHFESGAGVGELKFNDFEVDGRTYRLTGVMTLEKGKESLVNHFITFVRDAESDTWLECNDLNDEIMCFCMVPPILELEDVYILMYEANDNRGTVVNRSLSADKRGLGEETVSGSADIPLIDLADDTEKETSDNGRRCNQPREVKKYRNAAGLLEATEDELNNEPSSDSGQSDSQLFQTDSGDVVSGEKPEFGVFNEEMAALSLQEKAITNLSSPTITNGTGVLSEKKTNGQTKVNGNCQDSTAKQEISKMNNVIGNLNPNLTELKEASENQNVLLTLTEVNDSPKQESGKSNGQILNQTYKQLLHTLNASLNNPLTPPHDNPEEGKENVAGEVNVSKLHTESVNEGQASEVNRTQFVPMHSSKHNDLEMPPTDWYFEAAEQNSSDEKRTEAQRLQKNMCPEDVAHRCVINSSESSTEHQINSEVKTTSQGFKKNVENTHLDNLALNCDTSETKEEDFNNVIAENTVENTHSLPTNQTGVLLMGNTCENQHDEQKPVNLNSQIGSTDFEEEPTSSVVSDATIHKRTPRPRLQNKDFSSKVLEEESKRNGVAEAENITTHPDETAVKRQLRSRLRSQDCSEVHNEKETTCHSEVTAKRQRARLQKVHEESKSSASKSSTSHSDPITTERKLRTRALSKDFSEVHDKEGVKCTSYKRQNKEVYEKNNSEVLREFISSYSDTIEEESSGPNTKRGRRKNDAVAFSKTEEKNMNLENVLPRRRSRRSSSSVGECTNKIQNSVSPDTSNAPADKRVTRKRSRSTSSEVFYDKKVSSVDTDKRMPLYKNETNKSSTVGSAEFHSVDSCDIVERKAKVKRKRTNSKSPEALHKLEGKSTSLKPKRRRSKSSELCDVEMEHSEKVDSKSSEVLDISKEKSVSPKKKRHQAKSTDVGMEHPESVDSNFLKTLQNFTEKSESLEPKRLEAKPSELLCDGVKHSENAKTSKKLSYKRNFENFGPKPAFEQNDISDVPEDWKSGDDQNTLLEACDDSIEQSKNTKILQGKSSLGANTPNIYNINSNLNGLIDPKFDCNQNEHFSSEELLPSDCDNKTENCKTDANMKTCTCDCIPQDMDELIDIQVDSVLISIFRGFDIRKHT